MTGTKDLERSLQERIEVVYQAYLRVHLLVLSSVYLLNLVNASRLLRLLASCKQGHNLHTIYHL